MKELTCFMNESFNHLLDLLDLEVVLLLFSKKNNSWNKYQSSIYIAWKFINIYIYLENHHFQIRQRIIYYNFISHGSVFYCSI